jgi:succinate dehydrogenase cytochrome b subunit
MQGWLAFYRTTVGKKIVMAVTGAMMFLWLIGHMVGNLQIFFGPEKINTYAHFLHNGGEEILLGVRAVMIVALLLHLLAALQVTLADWRARPVGYVVKKNIETSYAARTMIISGPLIFLYLVYHLLMFTFLKVGPGRSATDVYANVVQGFQVPLIAGVYIAAMLVLVYHLWHGAWSMLQTLGANHPKYNSMRKIVATGLAVIIAVGFASVPVAVLLGIIR